jgi:SpoVK/Ycf46/Vps4 family AAA+-type ATPase
MTTAIQQRKIEELAARGVAIPEKGVKKDGVLDWDYLDPGIEHIGQKITLPDTPEKMPIKEGIKALQRKLEDEEQWMDVSEDIDAYPTDGLVSFMFALKQRYGWASPIPTMGFFGPEPPQMLTIDVAHDKKIQAPWGSFLVPGIEKPIQTGTGRGLYGPTFRIFGKLRKKESHILKELADLTREIIKSNSIYKGKAVRIRTNESGDMEVGRPPTFIDVSKIKPEEFIMSREVQGLIDTNILALIKHTAECQAAKIPLKRGVLLEGPYGTGKTLAAMITAKVAEENGWTFLLLDRCQGLKTALEFAKRYEPCVIFAEDIDRMTEDRDEEANDLLNTIDGGLSKDSKTMVVLTTNHVDKINKAMLRPGRLDAVISVSPPDSEAAQRLIQMYARGKLDKGVTLGNIGDQLAGSTPAVIREVVERSKLAMIGRGATTINEDDLIVSATGMEHHRNLLKAPVAEKLTPGEQIGQSLVTLVVEALGGMPRDLDVTKGYAQSAYSRADHAADGTDAVVSIMKREQGPLNQATYHTLAKVAAKSGAQIHKPDEFK